MDAYVKAVITGHFWWKEIEFQIVYGENPKIIDYCYSLADLIKKLKTLEITDNDLYDLIHEYEKKYYKIN